MIPACPSFMYYCTQGQYQRDVVVFYVCITVIILYILHLHLVEFVGLACMKYAFTFLFLTRV